MAENAQSPGAGARPRIDLDRDEDVRRWTAEFDVTREQLQEAIHAVGNSADDVEMHLKGSRSTTNSERVQQTR